MVRLFILVVLTMLRCSVVLLAWMVVLLFGETSVAQQLANHSFEVVYRFADKDTSYRQLAKPLQTRFDNQTRAAAYLAGLPAELRQAGYLGASMDSLFWESDKARAHVFVGPLFRWITFQADSMDTDVLSNVGWDAKRWINQPVNPAELERLKERILRYYQNNGYPFASVGIDQLLSGSSGYSGLLRVRKGQLYYVDSIRVQGKVKLSNYYLQRQLGIMRGSLYNQQKIEQVSTRIAEMPFVQEEQSPELVMLGTGGFLDLFLRPKKASQINVLVGVLPANSVTDRPQLTGDINLDLRNALGAGESILVNWQQLQVKSPRLKLGFNQPYLFRSPFGIDFSFDLFKKDSSFLQLSAQLGVQYALSARQTGKLFVQQQNTFLLGSGVDTQLVKLTRQLPALADVRSISVGLDYSWSNTDYALNPRRGTELRFRGSAGIRRVRKNNDILNLVDPNFNFDRLYDSIRLRTYQLRGVLQVSQFFPMGKSATLRMGFQGGWFESQNPFRNELFQIGGFRTLRGFDEESIFANRYAIATAEYRLLISRNSYGYVFSDLGFTRRSYLQEASNTRFISGGLGLVFETKNGLLNMNVALGSRNDVDFNVRRGAKLHFGYVNFF